MNRSILFSLVFFLLAAEMASAQNLSVFNIDASNFPTIKAQFYAFDAAGNEQSPSTSEITVTEDGIARNVLTITCPPPPPVKALSSVLVMDVSGSMSSGTGPLPNIDIAKAAATTWVNRLGLGTSECALTSFDDNSYFNQDFTTDKTKLQKAIANLYPQNGTNYDAALWQPPSGGLEVTKLANHQRVIIFLTDGLPNFQPQTLAIISKAKQQNCLIYSVTVGLPCPQSLKDISSQTGGKWYENITTQSQIEEVYREILQHAQGGAPPCEITWQSKSPCIQEQRNVIFNWSGQTSQLSYSPPLKSLAELQFTPHSLQIRSKPAGIRFDTTITVTAANSPFSVANITCSNPAFDINPKSFTIIPGNNLALKVSFTPADSTYNWTGFNFQTDLCDQKYFASGSYPGHKPTIPTLKLLLPNGGEKLVVGSDTVITWNGLPLTDPVKLEYSTDAGSSWIPLSEKATGGKYDWHVPNTPSKNCLAKVTQMMSGELGGWAKQANGQTNGNPVCAVDAIGNVYASGLFTGSITFGTKTLTSTNGQGNYIVKYKPDGSIEWVKLVDGRAIPCGIVVDKSNNIYETGWFQGTTGFDGTVFPNNGKAQMYFVKYHPDGNMEWVDAVAGKGDVSPGKPALDASDNIYIAGDYTDTTDFGGIKMINTGITVNMFLAKYHPDGSIEWVKPGRGPYTVGGQISLDPSGSIYNYGAFMDSAIFDGVTIYSMGVDVSFLAKYHADGTIDWAKKGGAFQNASGIAADASGNIYITGGFTNTTVFDTYTLTSAGETDIYVVKYHPDGNIEWAKSFGGKTFESSWAIAVDASGNFYITGLFSDSTTIGGTKIISAGKGDVFVAKFHSDGTLEWIKHAGGEGEDSGGSLSVGSSGIIYLGGHFGQPSADIGGTVLTSSIDWNMFVWKIGDDVVLQTDSSDALFSIVMPQPQGKDIDMGGVLIGSVKDSVISGFISNGGSYPFHVDSVLITGANASEFAVVSGIPPFDLPAGANHSIEFLFRPSSIGLRSATITICIQGMTFTQKIQGTGVFLPLSIVNNLIDFGTVFVSSSKDSLQAITIKNNSGSSITINGVRVGGPNITDFTNQSAGSSFTLGPGDTAKMNLRFTPSDIGRTSSTLLFDYAGIGSPATVSLFGRGITSTASVSTVNNVIDFGKVIVSNHKDSLRAVTIANTGTTSLAITGVRIGGPNNTEFSNLSGGSPFTLSAGDTAKLDLRFLPSNPGSMSCTLLFDYAGIGSPAVVSLFGEGIADTVTGPGPGTSSAMIVAGDASGYPGDSVNIPILLANDSNMSQSGVTNITASLRFNASLLYPIGATPIGTVSGNERIIPLDLPTTPISSNILATLPFRVMLGTDTTTLLNLENPLAVGGTASILSTDGVFHLLGTCVSGGARLFNPDGQVSMAHINPNPASGIIHIEIQTTEVGRTQLQLMNLLGQNVATISDGELKPGHHSFDVNSGDLPSGSYYLVMLTPTIRKLQRIDIQK